MNAAPTTIKPPTSLDILDSLVNVSLFRLTETDGESRLTLLETIHQTQETSFPFKGTAFGRSKPADQMGIVVFGEQS